MPDNITFQKIIRPGLIGITRKGSKNNHKDPHGKNFKDFIGKHEKKGQGDQSDDMGKKKRERILADDFKNNSPIRYGVPKNKKRTKKEKNEPVKSIDIII